MISEPEKIVGDSIEMAWRQSAQLLVHSGDRFNLVVHIRNPTQYNEIALRSLDPHRVRFATKSLFDVANTIFPRGRSHEDSDLDSFLEHFSTTYARGKYRKPSAWGTYFQRLVKFGDNGPQQLSKIIHCMNDWKVRSRAAFVVHLSGAHLDNPRPLGAPCWQYGQFIRSDDDILSLSVVYRSHDYFEKALGNFLGLARLLHFVCKHTNQMPGTLTCLSTYAHLGGKRAQTTSLLES